MFAVGYHIKAGGLFRGVSKRAQGACLYGVPRSNSDITKREHAAGFASSSTNNIGAQGPSIDALSKQQKLNDLISTYHKSSAAQPVDRNVLQQVLDNTAAIASNSNVGGTGSKSVFADTMTFPTDFLLKIVGLNEPTFAADMVRLVSAVVGEQKAGGLDHSTKEAAGGKYVSVSIKPLFRSAEELYAVYAAVRKDPRVKIML
jgi:putative lipoic acid-binding regulatory protein